MKWYTFDFETSNSEINIAYEYTRVWLWDIFNPKDKTHRSGNDIEFFFDALFDLSSCILYAHNLKFDGAFVLNYLLSNGFILSDSKENYTISTLITERLVWYTFTVHYNGKRYIFRDSTKKIIGSLERAGKDFGLKLIKGSIDFNRHRDFGYEPSLEEISYVRNDTEMLADILNYYYDNGMTGVTNASDAMKEYKNIISSNGFNMFFPILPKETDDFIRNSYKGGFCYLNPLHYNKIIGKVYTYDVKSMYPSKMAYEELPYGIPVHFNGKYTNDKNMPLYIQEIKVDCKLKDGRIPTMQTKGFKSIKLNYLKDTYGKTINLILTNIDLKRFLEDYEIFEIDYIQGYKFLSSKDLFKKYILKYYELKENSKGALKSLYKIFLNSLYGKFAMGTERQQAYPFIYDGKNKFKRTEKEIIDPIYTAVASFITSYARKELIDTIYDNLDIFIYCDTDSVHLTSKSSNINEGEKLGNWAKENYDYELDETKIYKAKYLGQKCYILLTKDNEIKKIAGAPEKVKESINIDNFNINFTSDKNKFPKFRMKNVKGGVLLIPTEFTIKEKIDKEIEI